jgi:hypothetical protein
MWFIIGIVILVVLLIAAVGYIVYTHMASEYTIGISNATDLLAYEDNKWKKVGTTPPTVDKISKVLAKAGYAWTITPAPPTNGGMVMSEFTFVNSTGVKSLLIPEGDGTTGKLIAEAEIKGAARTTYQFAAMFIGNEFNLSYAVNGKTYSVQWNGTDLISREGVAGATKFVATLYSETVKRMQNGPKFDHPLI